MNDSILIIVVVLSGTVLGAGYIKLVGNFLWARRAYYKKLKELGWYESTDGYVKPITSLENNVDSWYESVLSWLERNNSASPREFQTDLEFLINIAWYFRLKRRLALQKKIYSPEKMEILKSLSGGSQSIERLQAILTEYFSARS